MSLIADIRPKPLTATLDGVPYSGEWQEEGGMSVKLEKGIALTIAPWTTRIFTRRY